MSGSDMALSAHPDGVLHTVDVPMPPLLVRTGTRRHSAARRPVEDTAMRIAATPFALLA